MKEILCRKLNQEEIKVSLFDSFNRYQEVKKCWRKIDGKWELKEVKFTEQWGQEEYYYLVECLKHTIAEGGSVFGAFQDGKLFGFTSVENKPSGKKKQYLQLSSLHVSYELRGQGTGKRLFLLAAQDAKSRGAEKLYLSTHSSEETQAFYRAVGCKEAEEYNQELTEKEPCDCQMEYPLL